jgi:hypothetical protein
MAEGFGMAGSAGATAAAGAVIIKAKRLSDMAFPLRG